MSQNPLPNPFVVGQPVSSPEAFVGRMAEIATAFDQIHSRSNLAVWGSPGIGKSSFLEQLTLPEVWQLQGQDPSEAIIVLLNCLNLLPFSTSRFWEEVLTLMRDELDSAPTLLAEIDKLLEQGKTTKDSLRRILRKLGKQHKFLLLLVDNYDYALYPQEQYTEAEIQKFLSECRSLAYHSQERKHLSMIVTSSRRLNELGPMLTPGSSPWYNHYLFLSLKPFTATEVNSLLDRAPMTQALKEGIGELANGHPALLQNAGHLVYRTLRKAAQVTDQESFGKEFLSTTQHIFQAIWRLSNEVEQVLLMLIALSNLQDRLHKKKHYDLGNIDLVFSQRQRELNELEDQGVIVHTVQVGNNVYSFTSSMMEWWLIQEIGNSNETELQQRQKVFVNLMSRKQAEQVTIAIRWLWDNKDEVPSILNWIGKVVKALPKALIIH